MIDRYFLSGVIADPAHHGLAQREHGETAVDEDGEVEKEESDGEGDPSGPVSRMAQKARAIESIKTATQTHVRLISKTLTHTWIAVMRAMRRVQGKGKPSGPVGGMRNVLTMARKRGRLTSDIYIAAANLEHFCYHDPAASKIFEKGLKLFPDDEEFALAYVRHLINIGDVTSEPSCNHVIEIY